MLLVADVLILLVYSYSLAIVLERGKGRGAARKGERDKMIYGYDL